MMQFALDSLPLPMIGKMPAAPENKTPVHYSDIFDKINYYY
jgi:hypothetical protein